MRPKSEDFRLTERALRASGKLESEPERIAVSAYEGVANGGPLFATGPRQTRIGTLRVRVLTDPNKNWGGDSVGIKDG